MRFTAHGVRTSRMCINASFHFKFPSASSVGKGECLTEMLNEISPWNLLRTEPADMGRELLAVDEAKIPDLELSDQSHECDL